LSKIIQSIKGEDNLEIAQTLLYIRTNASYCLKTFEIFSLYPWGEKERDNEHEHCREKSDKGQLKIEEENKNTCSTNQKEISNKLHQSL